MLLTIIQRIILMIIPFLMNLMLSSGFPEQLVKIKTLQDIIKKTEVY